MSKTVKGPFGTQFSAHMGEAHYANGGWSTPSVVPTAPLTLHPSAHVLHYASACFEGLKAHRSVTDDKAVIFRLDKHMTRFDHSAAQLCLPTPGAAVTAELVRQVVHAAYDEIPPFPGALYLRPMLFGTLENIGAATAPSDSATLLVLASPVGDYFETGEKALTILVDDTQERTTPSFGRVKAGANYALALRQVQSAMQNHGAHQVLFCPDGVLQETGAANFMLFNDDEVLTPALNESFLHGVTRDAILHIAADFGYRVVERDVTTAELVQWCKTGEAALSGTAARLAGVGKLIVNGEAVQVGDGNVGKNTIRLRNALADIQSAKTPDKYDWLSTI